MPRQGTRTGRFVPLSPGLVLAGEHLPGDMRASAAGGKTRCHRDEGAWPWYQNGTGQVAASQRGFLDMAGRDADLPLREVPIRFRVT
jgi:hypothetical protein